MITIATSTAQPFSPTVQADVLHETARLQEIADLRLTAPEVDAELAALTSAAALRLDMPTALVSIVLDEAQLIAAGHGVDGWMKGARGTPVEWSFCRLAVRSREPVLIENMLEDGRAVDNPLVANDGVRAYAGVPLISANGHVLGTFCVIGVEARTFSPQDVDDLRGFAADALARIESRRVR